MTGRIVVVLGISGVGKTHMISSFVDRHPWVKRLSASALLKDAVSAVSTEALRTAPATTITSNQHQLLTAFQAYRQEIPDQDIIFDGHSVIDNGQELVCVPVSIFEKIGPDSIIFLNETPEIIFNRRQKDIDRTRPHRTLEQIANYQRIALGQAKLYGQKLAIPFTIMNATDTEIFNNEVFKIFRRRSVL